MYKSILNRSDLYEEAAPSLVDEGLHEADLVDVRRFANVFGQRVGLVFRIAIGPHKGIELMEGAAIKTSPRSKLAELVRGMGGDDGSLQSARKLIGKRCRVAVRHETTKAGKQYATIVQTFQ